MDRYYGIDNVTLRFWKFSEFCPRHTVGVVGDDIMYHILVELSGYITQKIHTRWFIAMMTFWYGTHNTILLQ